MKYKLSAIGKTAFICLGTAAMAIRPAQAEPADGEMHRKELIRIYSYAGICSDAHAYIETDGFKNQDINLESRPELLFWVKLPSGAAVALKLPPVDMGMIGGMSIFTKQRILGHDKMMADMRLIAADCAKEKPNYQLGSKG